MENRLFRIRCSQIGKIMGNGKTESNFGLTQTAITYLKEWYANDEEPITSKYMDKGIAVEDDLIDFMAVKLGYGMGKKNLITLSDEYFVGTCDVDFPDCIVDVKASWNKKTLHETALDKIDSDYKYQLIGYCHLWKKPKGILFYGLMNTPETDYRNEIIFEDMPDCERWVAYKILADAEMIETIKDKVDNCRLWLEKYDKDLKAKLGTVN